MIRYIQFSFIFDPALLQKEISLLQQSFWKLHYNTTNYDGGWSTIQLRSINGSLDNNAAMQGGALPEGMSYQDTVLLKESPYLQSVLDSFKMQKLSVRLMKLDAGAIIKEHSDNELSFEEGEIRLHIPILTNSELFFFLEEERIFMEEGSCWYLNLSLKHSVRNNGNTDRIHLVIDGKVNDWVKNIFAGEDHIKKVIDKNDRKKVYDPATTKLIIEQLRSMKTTVGDKLADDMEAGLNNNITDI